MVMLLTLNPRRSNTAAVLGHAQIAALLGSEILSGARPPGSRIPSAAELNERFGVARGLLREVIKTLAAKGMVASKTRVGTLVLDPSQWNWLDADVLRWRVDLGMDACFLEQLTQIRRAVEPAAAALAAQRKSAEDIRGLRQALARMAGAGSDRRLFAEADLQFHLLVSAASGNPLFRSFAAVIETALSASSALSLPTDEQASAMILEGHAAIVTAIEAQDAGAAAQAMLQLIDDGLDRVLMQSAGSRRARRKAL